MHVCVYVRTWISVHALMSRCMCSVNLSICTCTDIDLKRNYQDKTRPSKDGVKKPADTQGAGKKAAQLETLSGNSFLRG